MDARVSRPSFIRVSPPVTFNSNDNVPRAIDNIGGDRDRADLNITDFQWY